MTENLRSPLFGLLVTQDNELDIDGLVAYSLYKHHKREWCTQFEADKNRVPSLEEKLDFAKSVSTPGQLERYIKDAQDALGEFAGSLLDEERPEIEKEAITGRVEAAAQKIESQGTLAAQIKIGVVSTMISTFTLVALAIGIRLFGIDLIDGLQSLGATPK